MEDSELTIKEGYKQTDVGVIPEDWEVKQLDELATLKTGPFGEMSKNPLKKCRV